MTSLNMAVCSKLPHDAKFASWVSSAVPVEELEMVLAHLQQCYPVHLFLNHILCSPAKF